MELKTYVYPLLRWWWLLLLASVLAAATSFWVVSQQPVRYQTQTTLMVGQAIQDPNPSGNQLFLGNQLAELYADIAMREQVRDATLEALGLDRMPSYNAVALPNRQLLQIIVIDTDPVRARAVANELANQVVLVSPDGAREGERDRQAFITAQLDRLEEQITATEEEIQAKEAMLGELFSAREIADTQTEINALHSKLSALQSTYAGLLRGTNEEAVNTISIIEPAYLPHQPVGPNALLTVLAATAIALGLAGGAAYLLDYLDDRIRAPEEIGKQMQVPVVGTIARLQLADIGNGLIMSEAPRSPEAEGFRGLRLAVKFALNGSNHKSVLITSPHQAEGKSLVAANLALALAHAGLRTLLIDVDLHRPSQHQMFNLDNSRGLSTLLHQMDSLTDHTPERLWDSEADNPIHNGVILDGMSVMTSGPTSSKPSELLVGGTVRELLNMLAPRYDIIVLDSPPALAVSDAVALSTQVDSVFILASAQQTRKADLRNALARLNSVGANIAGLIINRVSPQSEYYLYRYPSYGENDYTEPESGEPSESRVNGLRERLPGWRIHSET